MSKRIYDGYAVTTTDFEAQSFSNYDIEVCKRYCRKGSVIVRTYRKKIGVRLTLTLGFVWGGFKFRPRWGEITLGFLHIRYENIISSRLEPKVIWSPKL